MTNTKRLTFLLVYPLVTLPLIGFYLGGFFNFITFVMLFSVIPLVDLFIIDTRNPDITQSKQLLKEDYFKWIVLTYLPVQILMLITSIYLISNESLSIYEWIGFCLSVGFVTGGIGITVAHELMHKNSRLQQHASKLLLSMVCYGHFCIEHVRGHHMRVATPEDPATARFGESLYQFLPRTIIHSFKSAWQLEQTRLQRKNLTLMNRHNHFYWILSAPIVIMLIIYSLAGLNGVAFFVLQSLTAILTLEIVNYIEHYGLLRNKLANGRYEPVTALHSWNANHWLSNMVLFHLQRHSDHHTNGAKPYQVLLSIEESPQLPSGYLGMIFLALIPPLWRKVMDPKVIRIRQTIEAKTAESP